MDNWPPTFVDALASRHRVVVFDNAGVGRTAEPGSALTITAMANQTSALISTLGLGRTAVLGWSMGGMIAQDLAVTHPSQVASLVLAATQAGSGAALPVPRAAAAAAASTDPAKVLSVLFPADQIAAEQAYVKGILRYPGYYEASASVKTAQSAAINQWLNGAYPAGRLVKDLGIPTLVADGTVDALDPVANDRLLAKIIPRAQLVLYPGAGHGFLFQDASVFVARVDEFLG
jgi:pimeloyl-ACP methyl ester carboxylesterase